MIFASNNREKIKQLQKLALNKIEIKSMKDAGFNLEIEENGNSFEENAILKAKTIYEKTKKPTLADDGGLCIDYFDGWPGIYTHRALNDLPFKEKNEVILQKMKNVDVSLRGAKVVCVLAYCDENGLIKIYKGELIGNISLFQRGENFFGFDSIFELPSGKTLAELTDEEKININPRGTAFRKFIKDNLENLS